MEKPAATAEDYISPLPLPVSLDLSSENHTPTLDNNTGSTSTQKNKRTHKEKWMHDISRAAAPFYKPYREIQTRQRQERADKIAKNVLAACVDKKITR